MARSSEPLAGRPFLLGLGALYIAIGVAWAVANLLDGMSAVSVFVVGSFIAGSGFAVLLGGYRLPRADLDPRFYSRISRWSLGGIAVMLLILGLYDVQPDTGLSDPTRSISILTGFACVAGFGVGLYDASAKSSAFELERRNEELERLRRELEASNERLEQFAHVASHDLQEPLRMVSSYLQLLDRRYGEELDEDAAEFLEYAVDGAERMREMIDALLEYARVETKGDPFEPVDLDAVLDDVRKDLELRIRETDATVDVGELPRVEGDEHQLRQLFQNLLSNAIAYSGDEPPRVEVSAERREGPRPSERSRAERRSTTRSSGPREDGTAAENAGEAWVVSVADEGVGIDPGAQDRIFDVFQRLHSQEEQPGTGIGLALCKRIVERHGGEIRVDSEPGEGTTFSVTLPAVDRETERSVPSR
ncbi:ATP-binding protein [Halovivax sp.]|uniref:ATP-binding protein n=1 Tax=Halovivax sp. TaxID=1935978 RepID=UPI0025BC2EB7|nr:ATP-binding protein [Halovivax sp.]